MSAGPDTFRTADVPAPSRRVRSPWPDLFDRWARLGAHRTARVAAPADVRGREALRRGFCRERARRGLSEQVRYRFTGGRFEWWAVDPPTQPRIHCGGQPVPLGGPMEPCQILYQLAHDDDVTGDYTEIVDPAVFDGIPTERLTQLGHWLNRHGAAAVDTYLARRTAQPSKT